MAIGSGTKRGLGAVEIFDERGGAALVMQLDFLGLVVARVDQHQPHAGVQERELAEAVLEPLEIEIHRLEGVAAGQEGDARAALVGLADDLQRGLGNAVAKRMQCSSPSRQTVSSSHSDSALTTDTPTPWSPPETL